MLSKQTASKPGFPYNPYLGATIYVSAGRPDNVSPRIFYLQPIYEFEPDAPYKAFARGCPAVQIVNSAAGQPECFINGKRTDRFTIRYAGRKQRKQWGRT